MTNRYLNFIVSAATLLGCGAALAAPAHVSGNNCAPGTSSTTIVCNIRSDGLAVPSGDSIVGAVIWDTFTGVTLTANSSSMTLTFSSVPAAVQVGQFVLDVSQSPPAIANGTTVTAKTATTVTLSAAASGAAAGDSIAFTDVIVTDNKGNPYTIVDAKLACCQNNNPRGVATFRALNVTNGPTTITATFDGASTHYKQIIIDEYSGLSAPDGHAINLQLGVVNPVTSGSITTSSPGDMIYAVTFNAMRTTITPLGSLAQRQSSVASPGWAGMSADLIQANAGAISGNFSSSAADDYITAIMAFTPTGLGPGPTAINCTPATLTDNAASGTTVCALTVTMSDGSNYTGTNTFAPSSLITGPANGNGNVTLARALQPADDGSQVITITATQNSRTLSANKTVTVAPAPVSGNPYSLGWKNVDPGASSTDGQVLFTAPRAMTVSQISMRVVTPASSTALLSVYKAPAGVPCANGTKLHTGNFNAAQTADSLQTLALVSGGATSLAIYDSVCLVTQQPFPSVGQATITVTAN